MRDQSDRTALITGANTGLGFEVARVLARKNARVLLASRSIDRGRHARARILEIHPGANVEVVALDLGRLASITAAADRALAEPRLDLLINNAGIMYPPREETADGFESQFGVNHLGHFALTGRLLPRLRATPGARIVTVSSLAHRSGRSQIDFDDIHGVRDYNRVTRYGMSKLANLLFAFELQRRLHAASADVISVAAHPGVSPTELSRHLPGLMMTLLRPLLPLFSHSPANGALPILRAATDLAVQGGEFYGPGGFLGLTGPAVAVTSSPASHDRDVANRLWAVSIQLTGVDPGI